MAVRIFQISRTDTKPTQYVEFTEGSASGFVRYETPDAANFAVKSFSELEGALGAGPGKITSLKLLEGEEEKDYLTKAAEQRKARRAANPPQRYVRMAHARNASVCSPHVLSYFCYL